MRCCQRSGRSYMRSFVKSCATYAGHACEGSTKWREELGRPGSDWTTCSTEKRVHRLSKHLGRGDRREVSGARCKVDDPGNSPFARGASDQTERNETPQQVIWEVSN